MHERMTAQDAAFLGIEDHNTPMQIGATMIFDSTSVVSEDGSLDMDSVRNLVASRLGLLPRYRQRVVRLPVTGDAFWIDDEHFDIRHHIKHVTLPRPADTTTLQDLAGAFFAGKLDRARPLWDVLIVDGLEGGRAAALAKAHHCLIDGVSGVDLLLLLLSPNPVDTVPEPPRWKPDAAPSMAALARSEVRRRLDLSRSLFGSARRVLRNPSEAYEEARDHAEGLVEGLRRAVSPASDTSINPRIGPNRRVRFLRIELDEVKKTRRELGGTVNDVVLAIVAGALRRFLQGRGSPVEGLDLRAMIPVSTRSQNEHVAQGNKIAVLTAALPVEEPNPRKRLRAVRRTMTELKESKMTLATDVLTRAAEWTTASILSETVKLSLRLRSTNLMVTNIRGPADALYCLSAPMLEIYPVAELWPNQALGVGVLSYGGFLHWGINADWDHARDVDDFVDALRTEMQELVKLAGP